MTDKPKPPVRLDENGHPIVEPPRKEDDERKDAPLKRMGIGRGRGIGRTARAQAWCDERPGWVHADMHTVLAALDEMAALR